MDQQNDDKVKPAGTVVGVKPYVAPELHVYGSIGELTRDRYSMGAVTGDYSPTVRPHSSGRHTMVAAVGGPSFGTTAPRPCGHRTRRCRAP